MILVYFFVKKINGNLFIEGNFFVLILDSFSVSKNSTVTREFNFLLKNTRLFYL